jgi:hypothetical protein
MDVWLQANLWHARLLRLAHYAPGTSTKRGPEQRPRLSLQRLLSLATILRSGSYPAIYLADERLADIVAPLVVLEPL